jgi:transcriptional regulator with GAF, ATPase, and Fis domain
VRSSGALGRWSERSQGRGVGVVRGLTTGGVLTAEDLARLERDNLRRALEATGWQIAGDSRAARLLGMAPSTLASRIKALGLRRGS